MGYDFQIQKYFKIKHPEKEYPWPNETDPKRTITLFDDDVLTKSENGKYMKHTGLGCFNIIIPDEDLIKVNDPVNLRIN